MALRVLSSLAPLFMDNANVAATATLQNRELLKSNLERLVQLEALINALLERVGNQLPDLLRLIVSDADDKKAQQRVVAAIRSAKRDMGIWAAGIKPVVAFPKRFQQLDEAVGVLLERENPFNIPIIGEALRMEIAMINAARPSFADSQGLIEQQLLRYRRRLEISVDPKRTRSLPNQIRDVRKKLEERIVKLQQDERTSRDATYEPCVPSHDLITGRGYMTRILAYKPKIESASAVLSRLTGENGDIELIHHQEELLNTMVQLEAFAWYLLDSISALADTDGQVKARQYEGPNPESVFVVKATEIKRQLEHTIKREENRARSLGDLATSRDEFSRRWASRGCPPFR